MLLLIHDRHVITTDAATGELLAEHHLDPDRGYQKPIKPNPQQTSRTGTQSPVDEPPETH